MGVRIGYSTIEVLLAEIGCRIMKVSKSHSALYTHLGLIWPSIAAKVLIRKLNLSRVSSEDDSIGCHIFSKLERNDCYFLRILQECWSLEDKLNCCGIANAILNQEIISKKLLCKWIGKRVCLWKVNMTGLQ